MVSQLEEYAQELVEKHGPDHALRIMEQCLAISTRNTSTLFFDEAEYVSNEHGTYELAKTQSKKVAGKQARRIKKNVNFYNNVINILKRKSNVVKN